MTDSFIGIGERRRKAKAFHLPSSQIPLSSCHSEQSEESPLKGKETKLLKSYFYIK
jgi:hypothetical protein